MNQDAVYVTVKDVKGEGNQNGVYVVERDVEGEGNRDVKSKMERESAKTIHWEVVREVLLLQITSGVTN